MVFRSVQRISMETCKVGRPMRIATNQTISKRDIS